MPVAKEVSVVFPPYNEAVSVRAAIERSITALRPRFERFEIIVVDDCSTDDTGKIAAIKAVITSGVNKGVMPSWKGRLSDQQIKLLTVYVHELGGGK